MTTVINNNDKVKVIRGINKGIIGRVIEHEVNGIEIFKVKDINSGAIIAFNEKTIPFSTRDVDVFESNNKFDENTLVPDYITMGKDDNDLPVLLGSDLLR